MKKKTLSSQILKVSLHGMDNKMQKMMISYCELNCKRIAHVVEESESQVEIIDIDLAKSKSLLEERLAQQPPKPIIVFSLNEVSFDNVIFVKKPIAILSVINALKKVKKNLQKNKKAALKKLKESKKVNDVSEFEPTEVYENKLAHKITEIEKSLDESVSATELNTETKKPLVSESKKTEEPGDALVLQVSESTSLKEQENIDAELVDFSTQITRTESNLASDENQKVDSTIIQVDSNVPPDLKSESENFPEITEKVEIDKGINSAVDRLVDSKRTNKESVSAPVELVLELEKNYDKETSSKLEQLDPQKNISKVVTGELSPEEILKKEFFSKQIENIAKNINSVGSKKKSSNSKKKEIEKRKEIRYEFYPIEAKLNKKTLPGVSKTFEALIVNVSSKGALIEIDESIKLRGKVTLYVKFGSENIFVIQAKIVRNKGKMLYGLNFLDYQHEFIDLLVNSGRSFSYS